MWDVGCGKRTTTCTKRRCEMQHIHRVFWLSLVIALVIGVAAPGWAQGPKDLEQAEIRMELHAKKLLSLSRIYGFWRYITKLEREETRRYLDMFYGLMLRRHSRKILVERDGLAMGASAQ